MTAVAFSRPGQSIAPVGTLLAELQRVLSLVRCVSIPVNSRTFPERKRTNPHIRANLDRMTTIALENFLAKAGLNVSPTEFLALVEDAARRLSPPSPNPARYFSPGERTALTDVGLDLSPRHEDERDYRARTIAAHAVLADTALTVVEAATLLGVDDSRIRHRLKEHRLTGWKAQGGWRLPAWQFTTSGVLPGLDVVLRSVPRDQPALVVAQFMSTPQSDLVINGRPATPRQWLLAGGDPEPVARLAATLGSPA